MGDDVGQVLKICRHILLPFQGRAIFESLEGENFMVTYRIFKPLNNLNQ